MYTVKFSKKAEKDKKLLKAAGLEKNTKELLDILVNNPYQNPPHYESLVGDLKGHYSRRINIQHRLVYSVDEDRHEVLVRRMWSHYEK